MYESLSAWTIIDTDKRGLVEREKDDYHQPDTDRILAWVNDGPDPDYDRTYGDGSYPGITPPASGVDYTDLTPSAGNDDIFSNRSMPKKVHWSVPWSDLMMTMFILFVVMYIYHSAKKEFLSPDGLGSENTVQYTPPYPAKSGESGYEHQETLPKLFDLSNKTLQGRNMKHFASVDLVADKAVRIILTGDLLFAIGEAVLKAEAKVKLKQLAPIIKKTPYKVNVVGHTDNLPVHSSSYRTNWELSVIRACEVARFFIEEMQVPENKFFLSGHSYFQPLRPHTSEENRAVNRRVEIILTKERPYGIPFTGTTISLRGKNEESMEGLFTG
jgi:chemotaxis protein MotB